MKTVWQERWEHLKDEGLSKEQAEAVWLMLEGSRAFGSATIAESAREKLEEVYAPAPTTLTPEQALNELFGLLGDYASFAEGFDHENHGDEVEVDGEMVPEDTEENCRFEQYRDMEAGFVLKKLIQAAKVVVEDARLSTAGWGNEVQDQSGNFSNINGLARALGEPEVYEVTE